MAKCRVIFRRDSDGPAAILMWQGRPLNAINFPRGHRVSVSEARRAKARLMRGCLVDVHQALEHERVHAVRRRA